MSAEIACKQNILVTDFHLLKLLLVVLGFGSLTNVCGFSRQNICSVPHRPNFSDIFDLYLHWMSVVRVHTPQAPVSSSCLLTLALLW